MGKMTTIKYKGLLNYKDLQFTLKYTKFHTLWILMFHIKFKLNTIHLIFLLLQKVLSTFLTRIYISSITFMQSNYFTTYNS